MSHDTALIATIAGGLVLAFVFGLVAARLRLPPLVGYLLAGVAVGPHTGGFVADTALAQQLAEIGVILLMFGVGIHFSVGDLLAVRRIALPGAAGQITLATALGAAVAHLWGWSWGSGIVFGLCLSVASTVVLLRALEDRGLLDSIDGRIAVGWLVVEDLVTVLVLVLLPALAVPLGGHATAASSGSLAATIGLTLAKVGAFVVLMVVVGRRAVPWLLERVARTGSRELFTLSVLAVALGIAVGASVLFGVSFALGAFFAGMVVNGSDLSHEAAADSLPLQDAFSVLFFVAVGMLFDPGILVRQPLQVLAVVLIVMISKSVGAFAIVLAFRYPVRTALTISASLAQVGEFSFILASLGLALGLLPREGQSLIVAGAILSISLNPMAFAGAARLGRWIGERPRLLVALERHRAEPDEASSPPDQATLRHHAILVGYGRVGQHHRRGAHPRRRALHGRRAGPRDLRAAPGARAPDPLRQRRPGQRAAARPSRAGATHPRHDARSVPGAGHRRHRPPGESRDRGRRANPHRRGAGLPRAHRRAVAVMGERELARAMARHALEISGAVPPALPAPAGTEPAAAQGA